MRLRSRQTPTATPDRRLARLVGVALFACYLLTLGGHQYSIDGIVMFQSAKQLFFRHSLVLVPPVKWGADEWHVSPFSVGFTLAYLPVLALWSPIFYWMPALQATPYDPGIAHHRELYGNVPYLLCSWLNPLITAVTGGVVFALGRRIGLTRGWAVGGALVFGVASPAAAYARYDYSQPLAGLGLTAGVLGLVAAREGPPHRWLLLAGTALAVALLTRVELAVPIAGIIASTVLSSWKLGTRDRLLRVSILLVLPAAAGVAWSGSNRLRFGAWTRTGYQTLAELFSVSPAGVLEGVFGLLLSPGAGILVFFPLAWLAMPGFAALIAARHPFGILGAVIVLLTFGVYASYAIWWAGWSWGPRFLVPILPLLALAATSWAAGEPARPRPGRRAAFLVLTSAGVAVAANGILFDFVRHYITVQKILELVDTRELYLRPAASPLVSAWRQPSFDLLLVRLRDFAGVAGLVAGAVIAGVLVGVLVWTGLRIRDALRDADRTHAAGACRARRRRRTI